MSDPLVPARPGPRRRRLLAPPAAALLAAVSLAGCAAMSDAAHDVGLPVQDFSDVVVAREPRPELVAFSHEVRFAGAREDLDAAEADRLRAFLARAGSRYGGDDVFVVTAPAEAPPAGPAAALRCGGRRR